MKLTNIFKRVLCVGKSPCRPEAHRLESQMSLHVMQYPGADCVTSGICSGGTKKGLGRLTWQVRKQLASARWKVLSVFSLLPNPLSILFLFSVQQADLYRLYRLAPLPLDFSWV